MTLFRHALAAVLFLGLAACGEPAADTAAAPAAAPATKVAPQTPAPVPASAAAPNALILALESEGLGVIIGDTGRVSHIAFGLPRAQALAVLERVQGGPGKASTNGECGAGPIDFVVWPDGLNALFQDDKFVGWSLGHGAAAKASVMNGIGLGSTRSELVAAFSGVTVEETTLGQEFDAGGLYGILDGSGAGARIDALWAGTSCVFR